MRQFVAGIIEATRPASQATLCVRSLDRDTPVEHVAVVYEAIT